MLPQKDTRELLYRMLRAGYLAMQDIPRTSDHAPSRTFYTFRVDVQAAYGRLAAEVCQGAGNVWLRLQAELSKEREVLDLIDQAREMGHLSYQLTGQQRAQLARLKQVGSQLQMSLMRLDDLMALFNDY